MQPLASRTVSDRFTRPLFNEPFLNKPFFRKPFFKKTLILPLLMVLLAAPALIAKEGSGKTLTYVELLERAYPADGPGAAAIVVKDGEVLFRGARGMADLELDVSLQPEHVFRLASITKQFTAAAVMILVDQGKLSVDDEITKFLPDYPNHGHRITVEHLLNHTSGVFNYTNLPGYMLSAEIRADLTTEELIDVFADTEMNFTPGEQISYSNSGYVLLGAIIEKVSGQSYAEFIQQNIFDPLGMKNSHYGGSQVIPRRVSGYSGNDGKYTNAPFLSMTQPHAAGSLLSTVDDMVRWSEGLFGGQLLQPESLDQMTRKTVLADGEEVNYGYGLVIDDFRGEPMISHNGGIHGFATDGLWLPESKVYVVVLSNAPDNPTSPTRLARELAAMAMGKPLPERVALTWPAEQLAEFVGVYKIDDEATRSVILDGDRLFTQRSGSPRFEIFPFAEDSFFYQRSFTYLTFDRDDTGKVVAMRVYSNGDDEATVCERIGDIVEEKKEDAPSETSLVSPEVYDLWAGAYEIQPGFDLVIRREEDRLISQATNQPAFELHPRSLHRYFIKEFEAELEFEPGDDGRAKAVTLFQSGQEIRAERKD